MQKIISSILFLELDFAQEGYYNKAVGKSILQEEDHLCRAV